MGTLEDGKNIFYTNGKQVNPGITILISDKIDLKIKNIKCTKGGATSNIQQKPHTLTADLSAETAGQKGMAEYI